MAGDLPQPKTPYVKTFECPGCAGVITIRGGDSTLVAVCSSCQSIVDVSHPYLKIIQEVKKKTIFEPVIPLGARCILHGVKWEVIGYMCRVDVGSDYDWKEYLLFNPYQGYRWLTQAEGHWSYVVMTKDRPAGDAKFQDSIHYLGRKYRLFHRGNARVLYVLGEFYWRVKVGDTVEVADFICPPQVLSYEESTEDSEQSWSISEYIDPEVIRDAFKLEGNLPRKSGVAPNQPAYHGDSFKPIMSLWVLFSIVLILLQFTHTAVSSKTTAFHESFNYEPYGIQKSIVTEPFELGQGLTDITVELYAPVSNTWLSINGELVEEKSGKAYSFDNLVEQYSGVDGGEYWSEGGDRRTILLSSIPEGIYHLDFQASAAGQAEISRYVKQAPYIDYMVTIERGVPIWSNFWWAIVLLSILPLWLWWRSHSFEVNRWSTSDYSPYESE